MPGESEQKCETFDLRPHACSIQPSFLTDREEVLRENGLQPKVLLDKESTGGTGDDSAEDVVLVDAKSPFQASVKTFVNEHRVPLAIGIVVLAAALVLAFSPLGGKLITAATLSFQRLISRPAEAFSALLPESHGSEAGFIRTIWLLLMSVVMVPVVCRVLPGATPVLGFLVSQCHSHLHEFVVSPR